MTLTRVLGAAVLAVLLPSMVAPSVALSASVSQQMSTSASPGKCKGIQCRGREKARATRASFIGMLLQATGDGNARAFGDGPGGGCEGCVWVKVPACGGNDAWIERNMIFVIDDAQCGGSKCSAPPGERWWLFLYKPGFQDLQKQPGWVCTTTDTPFVSGADVIAKAEAAFTEEHVPVPTLEAQPRRDVAVLNKPVIAWVDNHKTIDDPDFTHAFGITLALRAHPEYLWDFDVDGDSPGAKLPATKNPGAPYPSFDVSYVYRRTGNYRIRVQSRWHGEFQIAGLTDWIPITGTPIATSDQRLVRVREARAVLYDD